MPFQVDSTALKSIRVLDLSRVRAGPTCVRMLADFGADVIKVESPPGADPNDGLSGDRDGYDMQNLHRNKRSITINLKEERGREIFMKLVKDADVVVENYRPDVNFRLGVDYESLSKVNPRIILASISGFGQDGPYVKRPGFDQIAQGMGGLMSITGIPGEGPMRAGIAVADSSAGLYAAIGIFIAIIERQTSGRGQWVQSSLLHAMIAMCDFQAARYLIKGEVPPQAGNDHPVSTPMGVFKSSDGYFNIGASGTQQYRTLCEVIGRTDLRDNPDYQKNDGRYRDRPRINAELNKEFAAQTTTYWVNKLNESGVPCGPIYNMQEVFDDPQVRHLGAATAVTHPKLGEIRVVGQPVKLSRTPAAVSYTLPPQGTNNHEVLGQLGYSEEQIAALKRDNVI
jgi:crotonobetainyl-CoA:carnitine CoA-transferase CaiB-like acyl-CoA transferase